MSDDSTRVAPEICHTFGQLLQSLEAGQQVIYGAVRRGIEAAVNEAEGDGHGLHG